MPYFDLRAFLKEIESAGELKRISGASWDLEMATLADLAFHECKRPVPALLFENIPDSLSGCSTLFGLLASIPRMAKALGISLDKANPLTLVNAWRQKARGLAFIPPVNVSEACWQQNRTTGKAINLHRFPSPRCHEKDGGRYFGTDHAVIMKDPDSSWVNLGTYRCMLVGPDRLALHILPNQHGRLILDCYWSQGQAAPLAIAIGMDPSLHFVSSQRVPENVSEYDYAGGIRGQAIEVVNGARSGLPLPAGAEIVIEGECRPGELVDEGPFGEWHGYYANLGLEPVAEPLIRVTDVYHCNNPILTSSSPGVPPNANTLGFALGRATTVWNTLEKAGIPDIRGVWTFEESGGLLFTAIAIKQMYAGHAQDTGLLATQSAKGAGRFTVIVDDDIDPSNIHEVIWAVATRCNPEDGINVIHRCETSSSDTIVPLAKKREQGPLFSSRAVINACQPWQQRRDWYPVARPSTPLEKRIRLQWKAILDSLR